MTQCPYYYHSWSNAAAIRCSKEENHEGDHVKERPVQFQLQQFNQPMTGWRKH